MYFIQPSGKRILEKEKEMGVGGRDQNSVGWRQVGVSKLCEKNRCLLYTTKFMSVIIAYCLYLRIIIPLYFYKLVSCDMILTFIIIISCVLLKIVCILYQKKFIPVNIIIAINQSLFYTTSLSYSFMILFMFNNFSNNSWWCSMFWRFAKEFCWKSSNIKHL